MICSKCGAALEEGDLFCPECGNKICEKENAACAFKTCKTCGNKLEEDDEFCGNCGTKVNSIHEDEVVRESRSMLSTPRARLIFSIIMGIVAFFIIQFALKSCDTWGSGSGLTKDEVMSAAISMNEDYIYSGDMDSSYDIEYSDFEYEEDLYCRYIVSLHYEYEDEAYDNHSGYFIAYFSWNPEYEQFHYSNIMYPEEGYEEEWIKRAKRDEEFEWGRAPDEYIIDIKSKKH